MASQQQVGGATSQHSRPSSEQVLRLWQSAQAVCFDVDCTITKNDALDDLAEFLGVGEKVRELTNAAMDGNMDLDEALQKRLDIMNPTVDKLASYARSNPAAGRLVPGITGLIKELHARDVEVFLISGGFRELVLPVADALEIKRENIFANRFVYMADDEIGEQGYPTIRVRSFDPKEPTSHEGGKPEAIRRIRAMKPFQTIVMVGDGITDLEAVQETGGADLFVGYGGVVSRDLVKANADWWITNHDELNEALPRAKVAMVGSGAWACAAMQMVSLNARTKPLFKDRVDMWVFEEEFEGGKLTDKMNELKENPKYLPGVKYGDNVKANPSLEDTVRDADLLIICAPHQFVHRICKQMQLIVKPTALAISLVKGMHVGSDGPQLISSMIRRMLHIETSVLMGANIASEVGPGGLCEGTIGAHDLEQGRLFKNLFDTDFFNVSVVNDVEGAELAGTLKNIVALASGFADGCSMGNNAKATILREGLSEMRKFAKGMYPTVRDDTFYESCGVADLIATCYGGRNYKVAEVYARGGGSKSFDDLEKELLAGQKLQGVLTSNEVQVVLKSRGWEKDYPLFTTVNAIIRKLFAPKDIARFREIALSTKVLDAVKGGNERSASILEIEMGV